ncbi:MAG: ribonuclease R [Thiotrichales bacterium]
MTSRHDPFGTREAEKYTNPIASRELILGVLSDANGPLRRDDLAEALGIADEDGMEALRRRLRAMERDGQIVQNRREGYVPVQQAELFRGRIIAHPDGFGFLVPDEGGDDLFLSPRQMNSLLHGDRAVVRVVGVDRRGRREGALVEVIERAHEQVIGRFRLESGISFVVPDNKRIHHDILIAPDASAGARHGQIVMAQIIEQPTPYRQPIGRVVEVLGEHMAPGMEIDIAIRSHELPHRWSEETLAESAGFGPEVPEAAKEGRTDLRATPLVTIDGEDARDFDDAVFCERHANGWRLVVAIADVSAYVQVGTALDADARERATSVYFPKQVIPMLPEVLSNGLCSLNPQVDRLCMACELFIDGDGRLQTYRFFEAVMCSWARLTYTEVAAMVVERDPDRRAAYAELVPHLDELHALYRALRATRDKRGAIDFESTETLFEFDETRKIKQIVPRERNVAHKMIEECMIIANSAAAKYVKKYEIAALHRAHPGPKLEKIEDLRRFLAEFGLRLDGGDKPTPRDYATVMAKIDERPDRHLIQTVMLRSLAQAVYSPDSDAGHFGLAHDDYTHFTSPIRRYPDLMIHRAIRHLLRDGKAATFPFSHAEMVALGEHCSMCERRADDATRDAVEWLKCEFMQDKLGESYTGTVSGVTSFGLFLELDEVFVEGLVHITSLPRDYYQFDPVGHRLTGKHSGRAFRLGDRLRVTVARVDLDERRIDFELEEEVMRKSGRGKQR